LVTPNNPGLQVAEERGPESIHFAHFRRRARLRRPHAAPVPVNRPVLIKSFAEFQHVFGGLWQPSLLGSRHRSNSLDNGGREALIVRVVTALVPQP